MTRRQHSGGATPRELIEAAAHADWQQVVLNGGPPCFHFEPERNRFCLRARRWIGHGDDHPFVSLAQLISGQALASGDPLLEAARAVDAIVQSTADHTEWFKALSRLHSALLAVDPSRAGDPAPQEQP